MADDRYSWLDEETAERLLRGLPVDAEGLRESPTPNPHEQPPEQEQRPKQRDIPPEKPARKAPESGRRPKSKGVLNVPSGAWFREADRRTADRLASVLDELAAEHAAPPPAPHGATPVELPGEAAALHAFREAHVGVLRSGSVGNPEPGDGSASHSVSGETAPYGAAGSRLRGRAKGRVSREGRRGARSAAGGRPLRAGFAVALAGCALGGVAVAAGAGVLPTPFGSGGSPATSVSPMASPSGDENAKGGTGGDPDGDDGHDTAGDKHHSAHPSKEPGDGKDGSDRPGDKDTGAGSESGSPHDPGRNPGHGKGRDRDRDDDRDDRYGSGHGKEAIAAALCKAYSEGKLDAGDRKKLERAAGGRQVVQKFCTRYGIPPAVSSGGSIGSGGSGGSGQHGGGSGNSGGKGGGDGDDPGGEDDSGGSDSSGGSAEGATGGPPAHPEVPGASGATGTGGGADGAVTGATSGS